MQALTITFAAVMSFAVLILFPGYAIAAYVITLLYYPVYLVVQVGILNISASRIVVAVLLLRCLLDDKIRSRFKWNRIDWWVTFGSGAVFFIALIAWKMPIFNTFQNESGHLMDTYFAYLVARFCLADYSSIIKSIKIIAISLVPLALLGVIESYTGWAPYYKLVVYCPWQQIIDPQLGERTGGFYRAIGPFNHPILFGATFAMFLPLVFWLRKQRNHWRLWSYIITVFLIIGIISSMSSGPVMMLIFTSFFLFLERFKQYVKPVVILFVLSCILIEIVSNRSFYHVLASYADPIGGGGWHRAKLIDLAIEHFSEWWLLGYGQQDPRWGESLGMTWTDLTNHYLVAGVKYGFTGIVVLLGILISGMKYLIKLHNKIMLPSVKSFYWALGTCLMTLVISFNAIHVFGQADNLFYCLLGFIGSSECMKFGYE